MAGVAWIVLTTDDLREYLLAPQLTALQTAAKGIGQGNPFDAIMPAVAGRIRIEIQGCKSNRVSLTANAIPPSLKTEAAYLILEQMALRIPSLKFTDGQQKAADNARDLLRRLASCDVPIEKPLDPLDPPNVQAASAVELVRSTARIITAKTMSGI